MGHNEWLRKEIVSWRSEGIIDEQAATCLLERYKPKENSLSWGVILASAFGALMIGLGVIALFASNWDCFGRGARAVISMTPVVICGVVALLAFAKGWKAASFWEGLGMLWCISVGAAACLVAQTYNVGGTVPSLVLFVALLTLPVVWITRAVGPTMLWPIFSLIWMFSSLSAGASPSFGFGMRSLLFLAASLPAYIAFVRRQPGRAARIVGNLFTGTIYSIGLGMILFNSMCSSFSTVACVLLFWLSSAIVGVAGWRFKLTCWPTIALLMAVGTAMSTPFVDNLWIYALALLLSVCIIAYGIRQIMLRYTNIGACLAFQLVLAKFFESEADFTLKGLVLIGVGLGLTVLNILFIRYKRRRNEA